MKKDLRRALEECAEDPGRLALLLSDDSITDLDLRHALRGRLPQSVSSFVMERSRFGTRQTVLGAVARSPSTTPRTALQALPGLAWRDLWPMWRWRSNSLRLFDKRPRLSSSTD